MHTKTETIRQGDTITGSITTIEHEGTKLEMSPYDERGTRIIAEVARRVDQYEKLVSALQEIVKNDPYRQSSSGIIARRVLAETGNSI